MFDGSIRYVHLLFALIVFWHLNDCRADTYALSEAIERAKAQSPERQSLAAQHEATEARRRQALAPSEPIFTYGVGDLAAVPGESGGLRTYQLTQSLGFPGKALVARRTFDFDLSSLDREIEAKDLEITRVVKVAFYQLWLAEQRAMLNGLKHSTFEKILAIAKRRFVKDTTMEVEYLSAEATLKRIENDRVDIAASRGGVRLSLNLLLGLAPDAPTETRVPPSFFREGRPKLRLEDLKERFLSASPVLRASQSRFQAAESRVREAKWAYLPDFSLSAGANNYNIYAETVSLSFPIWFWWNESSGVRAASANAASQEASLAAQERALLSAFGEKLIALESIEKKLGNYKAALVPDFKRAFDVALRNYRYGKIGYATLTVAAESMVSSQLEYDTLLAESQITGAELEESLGGPLQ